MTDVMLWLAEHPRASAGLALIVAALLQAFLGIDVGQVLNDNLVDLEVVNVDGS